MNRLRNECAVYKRVVKLVNLMLEDFVNKLQCNKWKFFFMDMMFIQDVKFKVKSG